MAHSKSSKRWLREHFSDQYVKQAKSQGYRSRAAFKLLTIQQKDQLLRPGMVVIDLGAAPGSWSQVIKELVGERGTVIAVDLLEMPPLPGVDFIQGDFCSPIIQQAITQKLTKPADIVVSDLAPNMTGDKSVDQPRMINLVEQVIMFAGLHLAPGGSLLLKIFQGSGVDSIIKELRCCFAQVNIRKPEASRARSSEVYLLAKGYGAKKQ